jgi:hypothetical protein
VKAKSKVQSLESKVHRPEAKVQGPKPKAQRLRRAAVEHLASFLCAWLALALLVAGCAVSRTAFSNEGQPLHSLEGPERAEHRLDPGHFMCAE